MGHKLTEKDIQILNLLGESYVLIRSLASRCPGNLTDQQKLKLINDLAEASHNLPDVIATGGENSPTSFLINGNVADLNQAIENARNV